MKPSPLCSEGRKRSTEVFVKRPSLRLKAERRIASLHSWIKSQAVSLTRITHTPMCVFQFATQHRFVLIDVWGGEYEAHASATSVCISFWGHMGSGVTATPVTVTVATFGTMAYEMKLKIHREPEIKKIFSSWACTVTMELRYKTELISSSDSKEYHGCLNITCEKEEGKNLSFSTMHSVSTLLHALKISTSEWSQDLFWWIMHIIIPRFLIRAVVQCIKVAGRWWQRGFGLLYCVCESCKSKNFNLFVCFDLVGFLCITGHAQNEQRLSKVTYPVTGECMCPDPSKPLEGNQCVKQPLSSSSMWVSEVMTSFTCLFVLFSSILYPKSAETRQLRLQFKIYIMRYGVVSAPIWDEGCICLCCCNIAKNKINGFINA